MTEPTKQQFIDTYRQILLDTYEWAKDTEKLDQFMKSVDATIRLNVTTANLTGAASAEKAWKMIGCKGRMTYKALRFLPDPDFAKTLFPQFPDPDAQQEA